MVGRAMRRSGAVRSEGMSGGWFVGGCGPGRLHVSGGSGGSCGSVCPGGSAGFPARGSLVAGAALAGTVRKWVGGVARSVGVGIVERACRADVSRAVADMEQDGFCFE